ncbi:MAG: YafY family transcriptional regulator [Chloroflexi bacterium]|nr:YafY family transcriptional regulator [Chloroflexota bacterium]MCI0574909.1 YafY family transcriptional regulator [Chloroflexota bacterium]MCI0647082.1 YafY family transcriptional regulator [Chloroflexota bacterium]MCI0727062.1 YafY family transcriptional regulator [Chloroflexota bacterium]
MYSPTERLLTVLALLQSYKQMSGSELARRLEVDTRTVRRYIVTLQDMGIPIETERGPYGAYRLQRGYKLPPMMFTDAEAIALALGLLAIREFRFPVDVAAVEGARAKTERVMPEKLLQQVRALQEAITFNVLQPPAQFQNDFVAPLSSAVQQRQRILLRYRSWRGDESERRFDPYGIVFHEGYWYTSGYCHLRHDVRTFRLDRIITLESDEQSFERPDDFDTLEHVLRSLSTWPGTDQVEVLMKTSIERAQQAIAPIMGTVELSEDGVIFRRAAYQLEWLACFLMHLDFPVFVRQPVELRTMIRQMAANGLQMVG